MKIIASVVGLIVAILLVGQSVDSVDENLPPISNTSDGYFLIKGLMDIQMNLTDTFVHDITGKNAFNFQVSLQIWRNTIRCSKFFSFGTDVFTNINDGKWNSIEGLYPDLKHFKDFKVWIAANRDCEKSELAIQNLNLSYEVCEEALSDAKPICKKTSHKVALHCAPQTSKQCFLNGLVGNGAHFEFHAINGTGH